MARIKLGVAFAGGGVRGSAHLGIMQALHEHNIYPEIYTGTSAGSVVASLLAHGHEPEKALAEFKEASKDMIDVAYGHMLRGLFTSKPIEGFVSGRVLEDTLESLFKGASLRSTKYPSHLGIVTTEINKGKQIVFSNMRKDMVDLSRINDDNYEWLSGEEYSVSEVVRASCGLPPIFVPKNIDDMKLVDGGVTNNLPSDIAWAMGADKVISMDLGYSGEVKTNGFIDIAHMSVNIMMERITDGNKGDYGLYLNPMIYDVRALDTHRMEECFDRGYVYGLNHIEDVVKMLEEE